MNSMDLQASESRARRGREYPRLPRPISPAPEAATEYEAMRGELAYDVAAALGSIWVEVRCWLSSGGEPVLGTEALPPGVLRLPLRAIGYRLHTLQHMLRDPALPDEREVQIRAIAEECVGISAWAEGIGAVHTALAFAQLCVQLGPESELAAHAYRVGRLARKRSDHQGSWEWFLWTLRRARDGDDGRTFTRALAGMAAMYTEGGQFHGAKRYWRLALRYARAHRMGDIIVDALYGLCVVELRKGELAEALNHAMEALAVLAPDDLRVGLLAREVAVFLIEEYGNHEAGLLLLEALHVHFPAEPDQLLLHAYRARAAAGLRLHGTFEESWSVTSALLGAWRGDPRVAGAAWIHLSHAAALLRQWRRSLHAASRACTVTAGYPYSAPAYDGRLIRDILLQGGDRPGRFREEFPHFEVPELNPGGMTERFYQRVVESLGARFRGERVSPAAEEITPGGMRIGALLSQG